MGVFQTMVEVVNRTHEVLNVRFDGQDFPLAPNYNEKGERLEDVHNYIPVQTVSFAKVQNTLMGSEDPFDPSSFECLVGRVARPGEKQKDDLSYCPQNHDEPTRVPLAAYLDDPTAKIIQRGAKKSRRARMSEANVPANVDAAAFRRD